MSIYYVDIDDTIAFYSDNIPLDGNREYDKAVPNYENIDKINKLYDEGHYIVYWTARGSRSKKDWTELTTMQLNEWKCQYHELKLDKPFYDKIIDDRSLRIEEL